MTVSRGGGEIARVSQGKLLPFNSMVCFESGSKLTGGYLEKHGSDGVPGGGGLCKGGDFARGGGGTSRTSSLGSMAVGCCAQSWSVGIHVDKNRPPEEVGRGWI